MIKQAAKILIKNNIKQVFQLSAEEERKLKSKICQGKNYQKQIHIYISQAKKTRHGTP